MKIYIAGKISGEKGYRKKFFEAEKKLAAIGCAVMNPARLGDYEGFEWGDYMKVTLSMLDICEAIALLPGWEDSRGARVEAEYAREAGKKMYFDIDGFIKAFVHGMDYPNPLRTAPEGIGKEG